MNVKMVSAQDIRDIQFGKSFNGYKTSDVDTFLDLCAETVEELTRINAENEQKMQVLAEKVVEYRNQEESIGNALLNAQKSSEAVLADARKQADDILAEARQQADEILADSKEKADNLLDATKADTKAEQDELQRIRKEVADFKTKLMETYREHLTLIGILNDEAEKQEAPIRPESETVSEPNSSETAEPATSAQPTPKLDLSGFTITEEDD